MNKYQIALEVYSDNTKMTPHNIDELQWADEVIQELVDKETPMRPLKQYPIDWGIGNYGWCDVCNHGVNYQQNRCDNCGQKLDWSDEDE